MQIATKRRLVDIMRGFFLLCHPLPVFFHTLGVALFALLAAWPSFHWHIIVLIIAAHTAMQVSIAVLNDYCDRERDAIAKPGKPIPQGLVTPREALITGLLLIVVMLLLLLSLNPLALLISLIYLALGQGYNLGLKSTPLSGVVFALAIPLIPVYAFVGVGRIIPLLFWLVPIAALSGIALNLANAFTDLEQDAATGARTLAVVLGMRRTFLACPLLILLSTVLIGVLTVTNLVPGRMVIILPTLLVACVLAGILLLAFQPSVSTASRKIYFYLVVFACLLLAGGWIVGTSI